MILELVYFKFFFKKGFNYFVKMFNNNIFFNLIMKTQK